MKIAIFIQAILVGIGLFSPIALPPDTPVVPVVQNETQPDHYYRIAKEALDGIGASGYTLLINAEWAQGSWATTNFRTREISISTTTPEEYIPSVTWHEYGHILQAQRGVTQDSDALEIEADEFACQQGAIFVNYLGHC